MPFRGFEKYATRDENDIKITQDLNCNNGINVIEVKSDLATSFLAKCKLLKEYLVHHCDVLITFLKNSHSGTMNTINLAIKNNKKMINLAN